MMENVYPPTYFDCTEKLTNLDEYFKTYAALCKFTTEENASLAKEALISQKLSELLEGKKEFSGQNLPQLCSIDALSVPGEINPLEVFSITRFTMKLHKDYSIPKEATTLETIKAKIQYDNVEPKKKEFDNVLIKPDNEPGKQNVRFDDTLVFVRVYQPFSGVLKHIHKRGDKLKCSHEIVALGSNLLSELRDKIMCANDNGLSLEIEDVKDKPMQDVKIEYPSGLIGIDDTLYIDLRVPRAIDYSEVIKEWGLKKKIANFESLPMDKVQIKDLKFRLGYPYIYQHRGNCEHILIFSDVKLIKRSDPLSRVNYPYYRSINRYSSELCNICHMASAKWVVCECDRLPHDRTFLCQDCFVSYNYLDGKKIGCFKAYPYYNKSTVK